MNIPELTTARLRLRGFRAEDIDAVAAMYAEEEFARFITPEGKALTRPLSWRSMATMSGHWMLRGYGMWAVDEKSSGAMIGFVGTHFPEGWPAQEVGWAIAKPHWGKGYAVEAARASMDYAFTTLHWPRAIHVINPENARSISVALKLGSVRDGTWNRDGKELWLYAQTNPNS
jgi:RimJ/RimL family protein N-acetyltransferase